MSNPVIAGMQSSGPVQYRVAEESSPSTSFLTISAPEISGAFLFF